MAAVRELGVAAIGTFVGAWAAFRLERIQRRREKREEEVLAGNEALFVITDQANYLLQLRRRWLEEVESNPFRWMVLQVCETESPRRLSEVNLRFLVASTDLNLLPALQVADRTVSQIGRLIEQRNELHRNGLQPAVEGAAPAGTPALTAEQIAAALGPRRSKLLSVLTDSIYDGVARAKEQNEAVFRRLQTHLKARYPGAKFIDRLAIGQSETELGKPSAEEVPLSP